MKGLWGFEPFEGPQFQLLSTSAPNSWKLLSGDEGKLLAGQANAVHLLSHEAGCTEKISLETDAAKALTWKADKAGEIELQLPLEKDKPGEVVLKIKEFGIPEAETVTLRAYSNDVKLQSFNYHSGDTTMDVTGAHLEETLLAETRRNPLSAAGRGGLRERGDAFGAGRCFHTEAREC